MSSTLSGVLQGKRVVKAFHGEDREQDRFGRRVKDLANAGYRFSDKDGKPDPAKVANFYHYLYAPRSRKDHAGRDLHWSNSPSFKHLFAVKVKETAEGRGDALKLPDDLPVKEGYEIIPTDDARALAGYILGLKRGEDLPASITGAPAKEQTK